MAQNRPCRGKVGIGEEEAPFPRAGADTGDELHHERRGGEEADGCGSTKADDSDHRVASGRKDPDAKGSAENDEIPRVGGHQDRGRDAAQYRSNDPTPSPGLDADPSPEQGRQHHRKRDEVAVKIGEEGGPQRVLVDGKTGDDPRGRPPHIEEVAPVCRPGQPRPRQVAGEHDQNHGQPRRAPSPPPRDEQPEARQDSGAESRDRG